MDIDGVSICVSDNNGLIAKQGSERASDALEKGPDAVSNQGEKSTQNRPQHAGGDARVEQDH